MVVEGATRGLGTEAVDLLLELLELEPSEVSGAVLAEAFPDAGRRLVDAGALRPIANATVVTCVACDGDHSAEVEFDADLSGYRHFCPEAGWVPVAAEHLKRYRAEPSWLLRELGRALGIPERSRASCLVEGVLWDLGETWLGNRRVAVLLARGLARSETLDRACDALTHRTGRGPGVLLTTSVGLARHIDVPGRHRVVPLRGCLRAAGDGVAIDRDVLGGIVSGERPLHPDLPIQPSADFRVVRVGERTFRFRGDKQRQVVEYLYRRWRDGEERVNSAAMLEELEFAAGLRLRDLFKGHADWQDLIAYRDGVCWLKV